MLPLPSKGSRDPGWIPSAFVGVGFCYSDKTALEKLLLGTIFALGGEQASHFLTAKVIGKGPYFPAASQLRTCTEWNVFLRE